MNNFNDDCLKLKLLLEEDECYKQTASQRSREMHELIAKQMDQLSLQTKELEDSDTNASEYISEDFAFVQAMIKDGIEPQDK